MPGRAIFFRAGECPYLEHGQEIGQESLKCLTERLRRCLREASKVLPTAKVNQHAEKLRKAALEKRTLRIAGPRAVVDIIVTSWLFGLLTWISYVMMSPKNGVYLTETHVSLLIVLLLNLAETSTSGVS